MARQQPTAEQKAKAAERRERFRELVTKVAAMSDDQRGELVMCCGAVMTCEGRALSPFNSCLILSQFPTSSIVGGFLQWKAHGRSVKKGEHGLMIWVLTGRKDEDEKPTEEETDGVPKRAGFIMGTVFDVSQTETSKERERIDRQRMDELRQDAVDVGSL